MEEFGTIFIDYLVNIPSSPFMKILAVFGLKEYQSGVGNISHIHLLKKIRQLSEKSRIELFDLIRNNIVDIIRLEIFDDIVK